MAVKMYWYLPDRILYFMFEGQMSLEDIQSSGQLTTRLLPEVSGTLHAIADLRTVTAYPSNLKAIRDMVLSGKSHKMGGWTVIIGEMNPVVKMLTSLLEQMFSFRFKTVESLEEAIQFLSEVDKSMSSLSYQPDQLIPL